MGDVGYEVLCNIKVEPAGGKSLGRDDDVSKMAGCARPDPQRNGPDSGWTRLHIVHDQDWLGLIVHEQARLRAAHLDPDFGPGVRLDVDV
jgi:hypothetical protein